jgi:drug/metabolite transporter (DMT)-like permease
MKQRPVRSGRAGRAVDASFLFMRMRRVRSVALAAVRCAGATLLLLPWLAWRGQMQVLRANWRAIAWVGVTNSALPFLCFGLAALAINAGLSSIFNAATPLWTALIAALWLRERLTWTRWLGGRRVGGVVWLAGDRAAFNAGDHGVSAAVAIGACLTGTLFWPVTSYTKRRFAGVLYGTGCGRPVVSNAGAGPARLVVTTSVMPGVTAWSLRCWWHCCAPDSPTSSTYA